MTKTEWLRQRSWKWYAVVVVVLLTVGYFVDQAIGDHYLEKARVAEADAAAKKAELKRVEDERLHVEAEHEQQRAAWAAQQEASNRQLLANNQATARLVTAVLAQKTIGEVQKDSGAILGFEPKVSTDGTFQVTMQQMQEFNAMKLEQQRLANNMALLEEQLKLERQTTALLRDDLARATKSIEQASLVISSQQVAIDAYKAKAVRTRRQKILETTGKIGLVIVAGVIAGAITK